MTNPGEPQATALGPGKGRSEGLKRVVRVFLPGEVIVSTSESIVTTSKVRIFFHNDRHTMEAYEGLVPSNGSPRRSADAVCLHSTPRNGGMEHIGTL